MFSRIINLQIYDFFAKNYLPSFKSAAKCLFVKMNCNKYFFDLNRSFNRNQEKRSRFIDSEFVKT